MNVNEYKYDVAFSFLEEDLSLAMQLNNLIKGKLRTFIFTEKQEEIAGTNGEKTFNDVFYAQALAVIVLYREKWGSTPWTRIEQTAIQNRALDHGYEFTLFIPLGDSKQKMPPWMPKTQLWFGIEKYGIETAASVIEFKVQNLGGIVKEETAFDIAAKINQEIEFENKRKSFMESYNAVIESDKEVKAMYDKIEDIVKCVSHAHANINTKTVRNQYYLVVMYNGFSLYLEWIRGACNTTNGSYLAIQLLKGFPYLPGYSVFKKPKVLEEKKYVFDMDKLERYIWREENGSCFHSTMQLSEDLIKWLLENARQQRNNLNDDYEDET